MLRLYRTVGSYSHDIVEAYCGQSLLELVPSTFVPRRLLTSDCVSPNVKLLLQYVLYHLLQDSKTFPLARVHQYTSVFRSSWNLSNIFFYSSKWLLVSFKRLFISSAGTGWPNPNSSSWWTGPLPSETASLTFRSMLGKSQH